MYSTRYAVVEPRVWSHMVYERITSNSTGAHEKCHRPALALPRLGMVGLGGQTLGESSSRPDPRRQRSLRLDPSRLYENEAPDRSAGEVHLPSVNSRECTLVPIWSHTDHQVRADDPQRHVSADHEAETAHHLDLVDAPFAGKCFADPVGERLVIGHTLPTLLARREATMGARNNR